MHLRTLIVALAMFGMLQTNSASAQKTDYLIKDSFEKGEDSPTGWTQGAPVPGVKYVYDRRIASHGSRSLSLQKSAQKYFPIAAWDHVVVHRSSATKLNISAKVKAAKATKAIVDLQFLDGSEQWIKHEWIIYVGQKDNGDPVATHDWKKYTGQVEIPGGTKKIVASLQIYGPGKVWFDELLVSYDSDEGGGKAPNTNNAAHTSIDSTVASAANDAPEILEAKTSSGGIAEYILLSPSENAAPTEAGFPLVLIMPGGDGSAEFHGFVSAIHQHALGGQFIVAQPIAPPQISWPTTWTQARFGTTESSIKAIIEDVGGKHSVNRSQVYALAWSSSGPAVYASLLEADSPLAGAMIAMSVFKPDQLPPLAAVSGKRIYLYHSPDDPVCPYRMAKAAEVQLGAAGAQVKLVDYDGGHGWHGPVHDNIGAGFEWLRR